MRLTLCEVHNKIFNIKFNNKVCFSPDKYVYDIDRTYHINRNYDFPTDLDPSTYIDIIDFRVSFFGVNVNTKDIETIKDMCSISHITYIALDYYKYTGHTIEQIYLELKKDGICHNIRELDDIILHTPMINIELKCSVDAWNCDTINVLGG